MAPGYAERRRRDSRATLVPRGEPFTPPWWAAFRVRRSLTRCLMSRCRHCVSRWGDGWRDESQGRARAPIGVRAGIPEDPDERPWKLPRGVAPRDGHVELHVDGEWVQALLIEQRVEGSLWYCRVVCR